MRRWCSKAFMDSVAQCKPVVTIRDPLFTWDRYNLRLSADRVRLGVRHGRIAVRRLVDGNVLGTADAIVPWGGAVRGFGQDGSSGVRSYDCALADKGVNTNHA